MTSYLCPTCDKAFIDRRMRRGKPKPIRCPYCKFIFDVKEAKVFKELLGKIK